MKRHHSTRGILVLGIILILGIVLLLISLGLYTFRTIDIPAKGMIDIVSPNSYLDNGLFAQVPYMQYMFVPTKATKPNVTYRIVVGNGVVTREDKVSWTPLELEILKHKPIKYKLSQDEYSAIQRRSSFTMTASEIRSERNGNYLFIPVLYGCLIALGIMLWKERKPQPVPRPSYATSVKTQSPTPLSGIYL